MYDSPPHSTMKDTLNLNLQLFTAQQFRKVG